jgi:hypothetical protein
MGRLTEFDLSDGGSVLVEVADAGASRRVPYGPTVRGLEGQAVAEHARVSFEAAVSRVQPAVQAMIRQLKDLSEQPDEVQLQFGLDLHAEAGAFVAQASADANFSVTLTWRRGHTGD